MRIIFLLISVALCTFSCNQEKKKELKQFDYGYLMMTPDSSLTKEEKELKEKIGVVFFENAKVLNNKIVFQANKESFIKNGLPEEYGEIIKKEMENFNKSLDPSLNVDSIFKASQTAFQQRKR